MPAAPPRQLSAGSEEAGGEQAEHQDQGEDHQVRHRPAPGRRHAAGDPRCPRSHRRPILLPRRGSCGKPRWRRLRGPASNAARGGTAPFTRPALRGRASDAAFRSLSPGPPARRSRGGSRRRRRAACGGPARANAGATVGRALRQTDKVECLDAERSRDWRNGAAFGAVVDRRTAPVLGRRRRPESGCGSASCSACLINDAFTASRHAAGHAGGYGGSPSGRFLGPRTDSQDRMDRQEGSSEGVAERLTETTAGRGSKLRVSANAWLGA